MLIRNVELYGTGPGDCRLRGGTIAETGQNLKPHPEDHVVDGGGGALLPGLADHHVHLAACAVRETSTEFPDLGGNDWVRAVGYDEVRHGPLDRHALDRLRGDVPVRVQHRSGALWVINSAGLDRLGAASATHPGVERDNDGHPTGRLWRADGWLREALAAPPPSLAAVGRRLAAFGITHVTDATPGAEATWLTGLPQRVLALGHRKVVVSDHDLPGLDDLADQIRQAHAEGQPAAAHCVTREALVLTLAAIDQAGGVPGDRIEHCAVADAALAGELARRRLRVVTQPTLFALRGNDYRTRADPADRAALWPYARLLKAGVLVAPSSDAPYGDLDPWACLRAAADREDEHVPARVALRGMLSPLTDPGGPPRRISQGEPADVVLLDRPLTEALRRPDAHNVRATIINGQLAHGS